MYVFVVYCILGNTQNLKDPFAGATTSFGAIGLHFTTDYGLMMDGKLLMSSYNVAHMLSSSVHLFETFHTHAVSSESTF